MRGKVSVKSDLHQMHYKKARSTGKTKKKKHLLQLFNPSTVCELALCVFPMRFSPSQHSFIKSQPLTASAD